MESRPVISVIVPVYNTGSFLCECLDSIAAQTYRELEVIMIDDGSSDNSIEICQEYAGNDSRFILTVLPNNQGQSAARNAGLAIATGRYVTFVDSDDVIAPQMLESLYCLISSTGADMSAVRFTRFSQNLPDGTSQSMTTNMWSARDALLKMLYQHDFTPSVCGKLFTRTSLSSIHFSEGKLYEDLDFMGRYLMCSGNVVVTPAIMYFYRYNPESTLGKFRIKRLDVLDVTASIIQRTNTDPELQCAACDRHLSAAFNMFVLLCRNGMTRSQAATDCWHIIKSYRVRSLIDRHVRAKNKAGIIASFGGRRIFTYIARHSSL